MILHETGMICPYLGQLGDEGQVLPPEPHPSFAHRCLAVDRLAPNEVDPSITGLEQGDQILLAHQATVCLTGAHRRCPHYRLLHPQEADELQAGPEGVASPFADALLPELDEDLAGGPPWWLGMAGVLFALFLCAGSLAAYAGWRWVGQTLTGLEQPAASGATAPGQVFLLVTATPPPGASTPFPPTDTPTATATATPASAVSQEGTPSPDSLADEGDQPLVITTPTPKAPEPAAPSLATAVAAPVIEPPVMAGPPNIILPPAGPQATPEPTVIVVTATPTPVYPTPVVVFRAAHQAVPPGECTTVFWEVENARAVFYENVGVQGKGQDRICLRYTPEFRTLSVLALDGTQQDYEVKVDLLIPTPTPTLTPTNTPVFTPTPTWTPVGTPTAPPVQPRFGVQLIADGGNVKTCEPGATCTAVLQVANTGDLADEMFVDAANGTPWPIRLCRPDGLCGETSISLGVPANGYLPVTLHVDVPQGAQPGTYTVHLQAASGNSGHTVRSETVAILIRVP